MLTGNYLDVTVTHVHQGNKFHHPVLVILTASEGNPAVVKCEITFQRELVGLQLIPILRLSVPKNGEFLPTDLSSEPLSLDDWSNLKPNLTTKYVADFSINESMVNFSRAIAMCGVRYYRYYQGDINKRDTSSSKYHFESSFTVIDTGLGIPEPHQYDHIGDRGNVYATEVLVISTVLGAFGIMIVSLLAIVGFLYLKLRRATAASTEVNPLLYIKKDVTDLEDSEKKDTLKRETEIHPSNSSSPSQKLGIDHKLPDMIKSRENGTCVPY